MLVLRCDFPWNLGSQGSPRYRISQAIEETLEPSFDEGRDGTRWTRLAEGSVGWTGDMG